MAVFQQVFARSGVDESRTPTGAIVPLSSKVPPEFTLVRLTGATPEMRLKHPDWITHEEISGSGLLTFVSMYLGSLGLTAAFPLMVQPDTRYFKISGRMATKQVDVTAVSRRGEEGKLQVRVLPRRKVDLSIRPVQVRASSQSSALVFHSKQPFDINAMVDHMNEIWTPQANVVFNLVSSNPVPIIDEVEIGKAYDQSGPIALPQTVTLDRVRNILNRNKDAKAELTLFLVQTCGVLDQGGRNTSTPQGVSDDEFPIGLISDARIHIHELLAHEAGHLIGRKFNSGKNFHHSGGKFDLMMDGGNVEAIVPFKDVLHFNQP